MGSIRRLFAVAVGLALLLAMTVIGGVLAQGPELGGKFITGNDVTIAAGETVNHDLYVFGGTVTSNGSITGDIVAAGGTIDINGPVKGDVVAAGGKVSINGRVDGDVRAAGGQVSVNGEVTEDVVVGAGQASISGKVGQDLIVGTGQLSLSGSVAGSAVGSAGAYSKSGTVTGTDSITVTGNQAAPAPLVQSNPVLDAIKHFIAVLLIAIIVMWLAPRLFASAEGEARREPVPSFAWGILACVAYVVAIIVLVIAVILIAVGLGAVGFDNLLGLDLFGGFVVISALTLAFIVAIAFLADAVVGLAIGRLLAGQWSRRSTTTTETPAGTTTTTTSSGDRWADLGVLALGVAIVVIVTSLPAIGGIVKLVVAFVGLGALWLAWRRGGTTWWRRGTTSDTVVAAPPPPTTT